MGLQLNSVPVIMDLVPKSTAGSLPLEMGSLASEVYLIARAVKRDPIAFTALYDSHVDRVYRHVYYWVRSRADAEDITQEVFVRAWKSIPKYKATGTPLIAWLLAIARNLVTDYYRSQKRLVPLDMASEVGADEAEDPQAMTEASFDRDRIRDGILELKGEQRQVIVMRFIDGLSYTEIARALNKGEGAIRVIQFRALRELKRILSSFKKER